MDVFLIRHADAGQRGNSHNDIYRPLSERGRARALELAEIFSNSTVGLALTSPATRCQQTLQPIAEMHGLQATEEELLWEDSNPLDVVKLIEAERSRGLIITTHGNIIPGVIETLAEQGMKVRGRGCEKGSIWVLRHDGIGYTEARYFDSKSTGAFLIKPDA